MSADSTTGFPPLADYTGGLSCGAALSAAAAARSSAAAPLLDAHTRGSLEQQVQVALPLVPPAPSTERAAVALLRAAAAMYSGEQQAARAAACLVFAERFARDPRDDDAWLEFQKQCPEWPGLPQPQYLAIVNDRQYTHIADIEYPRVPTPDP